VSNEQKEFSMKRKLMLALAAASTLSAGAMAQTVVTVQAAPPAPVVQVPASPGEGYTWVAPHWVQGANGTWQLAGGAWVQRGEAIALAAGRDRDRDGTIDAMDDDKDNDGVPNRYDSHPNNRWRD
jgi:hypothetical protein